MGRIISRANKNAIRYSDQSVWDANNWREWQATHTSGQTDPLGGSGAELLHENLANNAHGVYINVIEAIPFVFPGTWTLSAYMKAINRNWGGIRIGGVANSYNYFDLQNGVVGNLGTGTVATGISPEIGTGWYRCWAAIPVNLDAIFGAWFLSHPANGTATYVGTDVDSIYMWRPQLNPGVGPDDWVLTGEVQRS